MLVNDNSLCVVCNSKGYKDHQVKHTLENMKKDPTRVELYNNKLMIHKETGFRTLVLSNQTLENLVHYRVSKSIRLDLLRTLPSRKDIIQVNKESCYKYIKTDEVLNVLCLTHNEDPEKGFGTYTFWFCVNLSTGHIYSDSYDYITNERIYTTNEVIEKYLSKFMVILTYLELTEVELKVVYSKGKSSNTFSSNTLKNDSKKPIIHVTSNWNIEKIIVGTFGVRGHMRCIPTDRTKTKYRYVPVKPYSKNLIMKRPQKELVN